MTNEQNPLTEGDRARVPAGQPDPRVRPVGGEPPVEPWVPGERVETMRTRIVTIHRQRFENPTFPDRSGDFTIIESGDWINCVAVTLGGELVMVEQYRYGTGSVTLEPVAGMVEPGEDPMETCRREVLEETGFGSDRTAERLGAVDANPAIMTNRCHIGLLEGVERVAGQALDRHEQIRPVLVSPGDVRGLIRDGVITHTLAVSGLFMYLERAGL
ncbi:MAG: NUDIX hydrolase [Planctomycetota bacterium]